MNSDFNIWNRFQAVTIFGVALFIFFSYTDEIQAQDVDSLFVSANKAYQQEDYLKALGFYEKIENNQVESGELYYNMANAYYKTNKVADAIFYYEKALIIEPNNKDILFNLEFAKRMTLDNIEELPKSVTQKFRDSIILKLSYNT